MPSLGIDLCPPEGIFIPAGEDPPHAATLPIIKEKAEQVLEDDELVDAEELAATDLEPGVYLYRVTAFWTTTRRHTGIKVAMEFTGSLRLTRYYVRDSSQAAVSNGEDFVTRGSVAPAVNWLTIDGLLVSETKGDLKLLVASENRHPVTLKTGSFLATELRS